MEQARKLVEEEHVLLFLSVGTPTSAAVEKYLNLAHVPQFPTSGATRFIDPAHFPWTMGFQPNYQIDGKIFARYILQNIPDPKVGVLYQNDDYGKDLLNGMKIGLGSKAAKLVVAEASYEPSEPTVELQIISLQASGANVVFLAAAPKSGAQAIRKIYDIGWKPTRFISGAASSIGETLIPAGVDKAAGIMSVRYFKDPADPHWANDAGVQAFLAFLKKYLPEANPKDVYNVIGYSRAQLIHEVLKQCGDELTHDNIMKHATSLHDVALAMLIPGIKLDTTPTRYGAINQEQLIRFDGNTWIGMGEVMSGL